MSTVLDSSLVALASDYASFGFLAAANNLWTWIAVISTAALSFWRLRASASSAISSQVSEESPSLPPPSSYREDEIVHADGSFSHPAPCGSVDEEFESGAPTSSSPPPRSPTWSGCDGGGATKGKFTTYYDLREDEPPTVPVATTTDEAEFGGREWWRSWERAVRLRNGEWEWYKFQDLRAINGNVVRLWDES